jgi:hypothetical protein
MSQPRRSYSRYVTVLVTLHVVGAAIAVVEPSSNPDTLGCAWNGSRGDLVIQKNMVRDVVKYRAFTLAMSQLAGAGRKVRRRRDKRARRKSLLRLFMTGKTSDDAVADPVKVAVLAIDTVAAASMRAAFTGATVQVAAPDEATASVLRAALADTASRRATDRLIQITVVEQATPVRSRH